MERTTGKPGNQVQPHTPDTDSPGSEHRRSVRWTWIALVVVIVLYLVLASVVAIKTPAWESPDEPAHVLNIETLVSGHWYAIDTQCHYPATKSCGNLEAHQAPLYYLLLAAWQKAAGVSIDIPRPGPQNPRALVAFHFRRSPAGLGGLYLHHSAADDRFILWLRFPNVVLGALTILITFFAVRQFARDDWTPVIAAAVAASIPHFVFLSAAVTNDNLVNLLGAVLTLFAIRAVVRTSVWPVVGVGLTFGLLVATKLTALPMGLVVVGLPFILTRSWVLRIKFLLAELAAVACAAGWYLVQNTVRYGDPLALTASTKYLQANGGLGTFFGVPYRVSNPFHYFLVQVPSGVIDSIWYESGWGRIEWGFRVALLVTLGVIVLLAVGLIRRGIRPKVLLELGLITISALICVWTAASQTATWDTRYALVGIAAFAGLTAVALERWPVCVRLLLPLAGFIATLIAIQQDVLAFYRT